MKRIYDAIVSVVFLYTWLGGDFEWSKAVLNGEEYCGEKNMWSCKFIQKKCLLWLKFSPKKIESKYLKWKYAQVGNAALVGIHLLFRRCSTHHADYIDF